jgi:hypothetical protein
VAANDQILRELIPGPLLSDEAREFYLDAMTELAGRLGQQAFQALLGRVIESCDRRPTIATLRRLAGLGDDPSPTVVAWELVTTLVSRHLARDGNGNAVLGASTRLREGVAVETPVPAIPEAVRRAVGCLGGWTALADSYPLWWGARYKDFKELYHEDAGTALQHTGS